MASVKKSKYKAKKKSVSSKKISQEQSLSGSEVSRQEIYYHYALNGLFLLCLLFYVFRLYASLDETYFWADENKHAYVCSLIAETHKIPIVLPEEIYGGFQWSYPPLFHVLGALFIGMAGVSALKFFNLTLLLIFFLSCYAFIRTHYGKREAAVACLLVTLSPALAINTVRFTTEMLTMLLIFYSFFFMLVALKKSKKTYAIISGLSTGLLMLSKQVGIVFLGFYFLLFLWSLWKNKKDAGLMLYIMGIAVGIYIPYLVWVGYHKIGAFNFISTFLGLADKPEWAAENIKSFRRYDSAIKEFAYLFYKGNGIVITISCLVPLVHFIRTRAKDIPQNYVMILSVYLVIVMVIWHITNDRHTITLLPLIAFLVGYSLFQIITNKIITKAMVLLLLIISGYTAYHMPDYRRQFNAPEEFVQSTKIIEADNSPGIRTLGIYDFDIIMYTRKPVIWPHPKSRNSAVELVEKQSAEELYGLLKNYRIKYILIDTRRILKTDKFKSRNYPLYFIKACEQLNREGKIALANLSKPREFILLKVI